MRGPAFAGPLVSRSGDARDVDLHEGMRLDISWTAQRLRERHLHDVLTVGQRGRGAAGGRSAIPREGEEPCRGAVAWQVFLSRESIAKQRGTSRVPYREV